MGPGGQPNRMTEPGGRTRLSSGPRGHGQVCGVGRRQGGVGSRARLCLGGRGAGRRPGAGLGQGRWGREVVAFAL